jgi:hypothetical protein
MGTTKSQDMNFIYVPRQYWDDPKWYEYNIKLDNKWGLYCKATVPQDWSCNNISGSYIWYDMDYVPRIKSYKNIYESKIHFLNINESKTTLEEEIIKLEHDKKLCNINEQCLQYVKDFGIKENSKDTKFVIYQIKGIYQYNILVGFHNDIDKIKLIMAYLGKKYSNAHFRYSEISEKLIKSMHEKTFFNYYSTKFTDVEQNKLNKITQLISQLVENGMVNKKIIKDYID